MDGLIVTRRRRPRVEVVVATPHYRDEETTSEYARLGVRVGYPPRPLVAYTRDSGVTLTLDRQGLSLSGFYDSGVGIEGGSLSWAELDQLRAELAPPPRRGPKGS